MKQCLTSGCDAPRYLVKASGYCVDCEDKMTKQRKSSSSSSRGTPASHKSHRRQRSLDGAQRAISSIKNAPVVDILKRIEVARDFSDEDPRDESQLSLVGLVKELGQELKKNGRSLAPSIARFGCDQTTMSWVLVCSHVEGGSSRVRSVSSALVGDGAVSWRPRGGDGVFQNAVNRSIQPRQKPHHSCRRRRGRAAAESDAYTSTRTEGVGIQRRAADESRPQLR